MTLTPPDLPVPLRFQRIFRIGELQFRHAAFEQGLEQHLEMPVDAVERFGEAIAPVVSDLPFTVDLTARAAQGAIDPDQFVGFQRR